MSITDNPTEDSLRSFQKMDVDEQLDVMSSAGADFNHWSKMPFWSLDEGIALLLGKDPAIVYWGLIREYVDYHISSELCVHYSKLRTVVFRALKAEEIHESNSPTAFLAWAAMKNIKIPEVLQEEMAGQNKFCRKDADEKDDLNFVRTQENNVLQEKIERLEKRIIELENLEYLSLDEKKETYAKELAIAIKAHAAVSKNWKKGSSVKQQIASWLMEYYPNLFNEERDRISKICNWQKSGGAPVTP